MTKEAIFIFTLKLIIQPKVNISYKEGYEVAAQLLRKFIDENDGGLKKEHYVHKFSYYTFDQMQPYEKDKIYKKGMYYALEIKTIVDEFKDMRKFKGIETDKLELVDVIFSKLYYNPKGKLRSKTPVYMKVKDFGSPEHLERLRENIVFRYLKSGINTSDDIEFVRNEVIDQITILPQVVTIPFKEKKLKNGECVLYHCGKVDITFKDNEVAKEVEKLIYASGLGSNTSNGFGYME